MSAKKNFFILSFLFFVIFHLNAQERTVTGKVTTFEKYGLNNVSVTAKKSGSEAFSDTAGYYTITCNANDKLIFEANGFFKERTNLKKMNPGDSVNVNLKIKSGEKNIEVATGYGHIDKDKLTHAIEHAESNTDFSNYNSVMEIIDDKFTTVRRGFNSFN